MENHVVNQIVDGIQKIYRPQPISERAPIFRLQVKNEEFSELTLPRFRKVLEFHPGYEGRIQWVTYQTQNGDIVVNITPQWEGYQKHHGQPFEFTRGKRRKAKNED
jgi:hypothetical protein